MQLSAVLILAVVTTSERRYCDHTSLFPCDACCDSRKVKISFSCNLAPVFVLSGCFFLVHLRMIMDVQHPEKSPYH